MLILLPHRTEVWVLLPVIKKKKKKAESDKANTDQQLHSEIAESIIGTSHLFLEKNIFLINLK